MTLVKAMATVGGLTAVSRIAGFIRDIMTAAVLGAGPVADAFFVALKLPNFFRHVTAEGAFSVSFVPLYTETLHKEGEDKAGRFAGESFSLMTVVLIAFTALILMVMPWFMYVIAPGFDPGTPRYDMAVDMSRVTFPYLLLTSLCALVGGMLNAHGKFGPFASTSIYFNLCQIAVLLVWQHFFTTPGHALAWAVTFSGMVQLGSLFWHLRKNKVHLPLVRPRVTIRVKKLFHLMGPGVLGAGIIHVNLFADIVIASLLTTGAISSIYYADRLFQLPLGVVGIAVGTALLPMMTRALAAGKTDEACDLFNRSLEYCLFFTVPATVALGVITHEIVTVLFVRGAYTAADAARTIPALACLSLGLPAYVAVKIFSSAYWSWQDTKTPVKIAASMALVNIVVALILTRFMDVAGIALATGLSGWVQCFFLWRGLRGHEATRFDERLLRTVPRIFLCAGIMGVVVWSIARIFAPYFHDGAIVQILALGFLIACGVAAYFAAAHFTHVFRFKDMRKYFKRVGGVKRASEEANKEANK